MSRETDEIKELLSSTGSEIYKQIGLYLHELEFTTDILDDEGDYADLFAEDEDCQRIGIPNNNQKLKDFIIKRSEMIIKHYTTKNKSKILILKSIQLKNELDSQNSDVYKKIGILLFKFQVNCNDINEVDHIKLFLTKSDLTKMGLKNAAKQKLAFRKVLRIINDIQKQPEPKEDLSSTPQNIDNNNNNNNNDDDHKQESEPEPEPEPEPIKQKDPKQILKEMVDNGAIANNAFWTHFFNDQKRVNYDSLTNAVKSIMGISNINNDKKRISAAYIQCIVLCIISAQKKGDNDISYKSFKQYTAYIYSEQDVIGCFEKTQKDFEILYDADKSGNFKSIQMDNFEDTLFHVDIYGKLLSSNFEELVWKYIISDKFISYLPGLIKLAFKFQKEWHNDCGIKTLEIEMFNNNNRMSSIIGGNKSSFYSLSESQLLYMIKLDTLAINEEKLYNAIKIWCEKDIKSYKKTKKSSSSNRGNIYKSFEERIQIFLPFIRFPLMSINFLLNTILPIKHRLFKGDNDDFLYILIYKINLTLNISSKKNKKYQFDLNKLFCSYSARIYDSKDNQNKEDEINNMSLDARLMKLSSENKIIKQKNEELKEKNHKLKAKVQKEKEKRKNTISAISASTDNINIIHHSNNSSLSAKKDNRVYHASNMFTTVDHFAKMHAKKQSIAGSDRAGHAADDSLDAAKHIKQVSRTVVNQVDDLKAGDKTINFLIKYSEEDNKESQDLFEQMRKKMTDRSKKVKRAHDRKLEKEQEEIARRVREREEMEETKRKLREQAKKLKRSADKKKKRESKKGKKHQVMRKKYDMDEDQDNDNDNDEHYSFDLSALNKKDKDKDNDEHHSFDLSALNKKDKDKGNELAVSIDLDTEQSWNEEQQQEQEQEEEDMDGNNAGNKTVVTKQDDDSDIDEEYDFDAFKKKSVEPQQEEENDNDGGNEQEEVQTNNDDEIQQQQQQQDIDRQIVVSSVLDNNYGYAQVHDAMKTYYMDKNSECTNPTHLILYAKKNGIKGVSFANANKYFKGRRNDPNVVSIEDLMANQENVDENDLSHLMSNPGKSVSPQPVVVVVNVDNNNNNNNNDGNDSDHSGHSGHRDESPPITITQSITHKTPEKDSVNDNDNNNINDDVDDDAKQQIMDTLIAVQSEEPKKRRKSKPNMDGGGKSKKKKKKKEKELYVAAEMLGKLKKTTNYTRFERPLYILPLNVAQRKKTKDEKRMIRDLGLHLGYKVLLKQKNMKGTIKFIGSVHFTYGIIVGLEMAGNGNGKHAGDIDKIRYFECKRNGGLFVRADSIEKIIEKKKLKTVKKNKSLDKVTGERFKSLLLSMEEIDDDEEEEIDLSSLSKKERIRLERLHLEIGDVVEVDKGRKGILHFCGNVHWTDDLIFGVEFMDKAVGKYNGTYGDITYFKCPEKRGIFFTSDKIRKKGILNSLSQW